MGSLSTPAFWDLHVHGAAGIDFMHASPDEMAFACEWLGRNGTGAFAPTLLSAPPKMLAQACRRWGAFLERCAQPRFLPTRSARPVGLHLEGPFLNPEMAGAHPENALQRPAIAACAELVREARGFVAIMTLAPELAGALEVIRFLARRNVRVQLGHSRASALEAERAVRAGARGITHLYNAMHVHHRAPGLLSPLMRGQLTAEVITDGVHLDPEFLGWCLKAAGPSLYAVSDACSAMGATSGTPLTLGSLKICRRGAIAVVRANGVLCGGATALATHPGRLHQALQGRVALGPDFLRMFHAPQRRCLPHARPAPLRNHFNAKTFKFLGCD